jgi:hypothetical protein
LQIAGEHERAALMWAERGCRYEAALTLADSTAAITVRRLRAQGARGIPRGPHARTRTKPAGLSDRASSMCCEPPAVAVAALARRSGHDAAAYGRASA